MRTPAIISPTTCGWPTKRARYRRGGRRGGSPPAPGRRRRRARGSTRGTDFTRSCGSAQPGTTPSRPPGPLSPSLDSTRRARTRLLPLALLAPRRPPPLRRPAVASLLLLAAGARSGHLDGDLPIVLWLPLVLGVDVAHVWSTGWRVYADPRNSTAARALPRGAGSRLRRRRSPPHRRVPRLLARPRLPRDVPLRAPAVRLGRPLPAQGRRDDEPASRGNGVSTRRRSTARLSPLSPVARDAPEAVPLAPRGGLRERTAGVGGPRGPRAFGAVFAIWLAKEGRRLATGRPVSWERPSSS